MLDKIASFFETVGTRNFGVSVKIPRPTTEQKRRSILTNGTIGSVLVVFGILFEKKSLTLLGVISLLGSLFLSADE